MTVESWSQDFSPILLACKNKNNAFSLTGNTFKDDFSFDTNLQILIFLLMTRFVAERQQRSAASSITCNIPLLEGYAHTLQTMRSHRNDPGPIAEQ